MPGNAPSSSARQICGHEVTELRRGFRRVALHGEARPPLHLRSRTKDAKPARLDRLLDQRRAYKLGEGSDCESPIQVATHRQRDEPLEPLAALLEHTEEREEQALVSAGLLAHRKQW